MRKYLVAMVLAGAVLGSSSVAVAQEDTVIREADRTIFKKKTVIDFSDVTLEGELTKPEGSYLVNRKRANFSSLIKMRDNFLPELQKSTDNL